MAKRNRIHKRKQHELAFSVPVRQTTQDKEARLKHEARCALERNLERERSAGGYKSTQDYRASLAETRLQREGVLLALADSIRREHTPGVDACVDTTYTMTTTAGAYRKQHHNQRMWRTVEWRVLNGRVGVYLGGKFADGYDGPRENVDWGERMRSTWWQQSTLWVQGLQTTGVRRDDDDIVMHSTYPAVEYYAVLSVKVQAEAIEVKRIVHERAQVIAFDFEAAAALRIAVEKAA